MIIEKNTGLILALDLTDRIELLNLAKEISPYVDAIKIGNPTLFSCGISIIDEIKSVSGVPVIGDFKFVDVPFITLTNISILRNKGIDGIMLWGMVGKEAIRRAKNVLGYNRMLFVITAFTCSDAQKFTEPFWKDFTQLASDLDVFGIQVPGTKPERIPIARSILHNNQKIICCGIGAQGPKPGSAIYKGADWEIIGREIYDTIDPVRRANEVVEEIKYYTDNDSILTNYCEVFKK